MDKDGALSSSVIVNVPVASLIVAFDALDKIRMLRNLEGLIFLKIFRVQCSNIWSKFESKIENFEKIDSFNE